MPIIFERLNVFKMTKYVNLGLLFGLKRASAGRTENSAQPTNYLGKNSRTLTVPGSNVTAAQAFDKYDSLGSRSWELKALTPSWLWEAVYAEFMIRTKIALGKNPVHVPWYVPTSFGGLGIVPPAEGISLLDKQVCLKMVNDPSAGFGRAIVPAESWSVHKVVMGEVPVKAVTGLRSDKSVELSEKVWDSLYGRLCVSTMFTKDLDQLFIGDPHADSGKVLRSNERHWRKVKNHGNLPGRALAMSFDPYVYGKDMCSYVQCTLNPVGSLEVPGIGMLVDQQLLDSNIPPNSVIRNY
jgi:hypothetical protein